MRGGLICVVSRGRYCVVRGDVYVTRVSVVTCRVLTPGFCLCRPDARDRVDGRGRRIIYFASTVHNLSPSNLLRASTGKIH